MISLSTSWGLPFPPMIRTKFRCVFSVNDANGSAGTNANACQYVFPGNYPMNCFPSKNYPLGTLTAPAASQYASGLHYLWGADGAGGAANGAYQFLLCLGSSCEIQYIPASADTSMANLVLNPVSGGYASTASTIVTSQQAEQPYAVRAICTQTPNAGVVTLKNAITTQRYYGLSRLGTDDSGYVCTVSTGPAAAWCWSLQINNLDSSTNGRNSTFLVALTYDVILFALNQMTTTQPA